MRKAKVAALIIGGVSTCIFGGVFGVVATSPIVKSVAPNNDVQNIYEVQSEELANVAAVTSIRTTPITTTSKNTYEVSIGTTTTSAKTVFQMRTELPALTLNSANALAKPNNKDNKNEQDVQTPTQAVTTAKVTTVSTAPTTTKTTSTTTSTTTTTTTTVVTTSATTAVVTEIIVTEAPTEAPTQAPTYTEPVTEAPTEAPPETTTESVETVTPVLPDETVELPITDEEFIILCNAVAHEAGCNWISTYDKALVVEVIMNRVESPLYPNTILGVLTQPYQFTGSSNYVYLGNYSGYVTQDVKDAVTLYFTETESFGHGYFGFYGDGVRNYFY
ncbi:MAG: cell wall hydrolase [Ruminococcus sp.]|nr:cell wall hydrolase [Ruminococcus sp.]